MDEERLRFEIATKVMGLEVEQATYDGYEELTDFADKDPKYEMFYWPEGSMDRKPIPRYPYNMSDAWKVVEHFMASADLPRRQVFKAWFIKANLWSHNERDAATKLCLGILGCIQYVELYPEFNKEAM